MAEIAPNKHPESFSQLDRTFISMPLVSRPGRSPPHRWAYLGPPDQRERHALLHRDQVPQQIGEQLLGERTTIEISVQRRSDHAVGRVE